MCREMGLLLVALGLSGAMGQVRSIIQSDGSLAALIIEKKGLMIFLPLDTMGSICLDTFRYSFL